MSEDCWSPWPFHPAPASRVSKGLFMSVNCQGYWGDGHRHLDAYINNIREIFVDFQLRRCSSTSPNVCVCVSVRPSVVNLKICLLHPSTTSRMFQYVPERSRMFQNVPECSRMFQNVPECSRRVQNVLEGSKMFQKVPECMQNVLECSKLHALYSSMHAAT